MSTPPVIVVDFGSGNLASIRRALEHLGADVRLADDAKDINRAQRLVLPGVGAFGNGMRELHRRDLSGPIRERTAAGIPLLGICLGAQMLLDGSDEFGRHPGLGLIPGEVRAIPDRDRQRRPLKVPHMGWADLLPAAGDAFAHPLLVHLHPGAAAYFVHSFQMHPARPGDLVAVSDYGGHALTAMVSHARVFGCQFHPEKSGAVGLRILQNFLELE